MIEAGRMIPPGSLHLSQQKPAYPYKPCSHDLLRSEGFKGFSQQTESDIIRCTGTFFRDRLALICHLLDLSCYPYCSPPIPIPLAGTGEPQSPWLNWQLTSNGLPKHRLDRYSAHSRHSTSACSKTVCAAFSCLSGG
jgi:hypothetical protein